MHVEIPCGQVVLPGELSVPLDPMGVVIFVHGSGSSRHSPRNQFVAEELNSKGFATLLFDLLTTEEERNRENVFDIELLATRLVDVTAWLKVQPSVVHLPIAYFGASTGAAAALAACANLGSEISAVVSRGGRVDLAGPYLSKVTAPTLMIVGQEDREVLALNREAAKAMACAHEISFVPFASHLFEEPGALEVVAEEAGRWCRRYLKGLGHAVSGGC